MIDNSGKKARLEVELVAHTLNKLDLIAKVRWALPVMALADLALVTPLIALVDNRALAYMANLNPALEGQAARSI